MEPTLFYYFCRTMMMAGYLLAMLDGASTMSSVYYGGTSVEKNPIWRTVMRSIGTTWVIPRLLLALGIIWLSVGNAFAPYHWWAVVGAILPNLILAYVVWSNFRIAKALREKARSEYR